LDIQEIERGAVPLVNEHEMDSRPSHPHEWRRFVKAAYFNVIQRHFPGKNSEAKVQLL
jgi:hypothetical protein